MTQNYTPLPVESLERLWPVPDDRPEEAWTHADCGLVVTNRADHDPQVGKYPCPSPH